ncbi:PREDICTED: interleukin-6 isoform X1 [Rhinopithecus bieti]|uniref:interleukin-6 isoform X1 n=1 Tax=Rhinopithecus bieti TaxID=61621 RepID=UPI00083C569D|nr:PREDICTED: interleukin-6 isoform X1 [Rhinopithecus bieti]
MNSVSTSKCRKSLALERPAAVEPCVREGCVAQRGLAGGQQQRQAPSCAVSSRRRSLPSGTGAFGPVAFSLGLLLVLPAAFPAPVLLGEDSKDVAAPHSQPLTSSERIDKHIRYILDGISALRKETCNRSNMCESSKEALAENNLNLPKMAEKDGCFQSGFNEETCLVKIITGLLEFEVYLEYLQNRFESSEEQARAVQMSTKVLIQFLQKKAKNLDAITTPEPTTNASLLTKLQAQNQWLQDMTTHLILRSFKEFLQSSLRALRQM